MAFQRQTGRLTPISSSLQTLQSSRLLNKLNPFPSVLASTRPAAVTCESRATVGYDVQERLRQVAIPSKALQKDVPLPFGQLATVLVQQQREVTKLGGIPAKGFVEQEVLGRRRQPLGSPQNMADAHVMVIHHIRQVVSGEAVPLENHRVALHVSHLMPGPPIDQVPKGLQPLLQPEPDHPVQAPRQLLRHFCGRQVPTPVVVSLRKENEGLGSTQANPISHFYVPKTLN